MFDMSWVLGLVAGWLVVAAVVGLFAWALARAAALGDRDQLEQLALAGAVAAEARAHDRRAGPADRRTATRPWADKAPGRRAQDIFRKELDDVNRALRDAEERIGEIEARQSA